MDLLHHLQQQRRNRKERRQAYSLVFTDDNGTPATWTLVLFQQAIDKLKDASTTGTTGDTPFTGHSHYYRTRTRRKTTCLVGTPSIEATTNPAPAGTTTNHDSQPTPRRRLRIAPSLRIAPGHSRLDPGLPTTDVDHRLLGKINQMGTHLPFGHQSVYLI